MTNLTEGQIPYSYFADMSERFTNYVKEHNSDPESIRIHLDGDDSVSTPVFQDMEKRVNKYILDNSQPPLIVYINKPVDTPTQEVVPEPPANADTWLDQVRRASGLPLDRYEDFLDNCVRGRGYDYYYNSRYDNELAAWLSGNAMNCTDWTKFVCLIARDYGIDFRVINLVCQSGTGHVRCQIQAKAGGWLDLDAAGLSDKESPSYPLYGWNWCAVGYRNVAVGNTNEIWGWM
jgi:hypothetical protein